MEFDSIKLIDYLLLYVWMTKATPFEKDTIIGALIKIRKDIEELKEKKRRN